MSLPALILNDDGGVSANNQSSPIPLHTQTLLEQLSSFANPSAATSTTIDEATTASSPPPKAPTSPDLADHTGDSNDQPPLMDPSKTESGVDAEHSDASSASTPPGDSAANVLEVSDKGATARPKKRARAEALDEEDSVPSPKRVADGSTSETKPASTVTPAETVNSPESAINNSKDDASEVAEPEEQPQKSRKPPPKKATAKAGRIRACATCKRRKVKCTHNTANEEATREEGRTPKAKAKVPPGPATKMDDTTIYDIPADEQPPNPTKSKKNPAPKEPIAPPERASTRTSTRTCRPPQPPTSPTPPTPKKRPSRVFDPTYITTNSSSRLAKADLYHLLTDDASAWTCLTPAQQTTLISLLPPTPENQQILERIWAGETHDTRPGWLSKGDVFRAEVAKYKQDLGGGHLARGWQREARVAVGERAEGVFDGWKGGEAEAWWGQKGG